MSSTKEATVEICNEETKEDGQYAADRVVYLFCVTEFIKMYY